MGTERKRAPKDTASVSSSSPVSNDIIITIHPNTASSAPVRQSSISSPGSSVAAANSHSTVRTWNEKIKAGISSAYSFTKENVFSFLPPIKPIQTTKEKLLLWGSRAVKLGASGLASYTAFYSFRDSDTLKTYFGAYDSYDAIRYIGASSIAFYTFIQVQKTLIDNNEREIAALKQKLADEKKSQSLRIKVLENQLKDEKKSQATSIEDLKNQLLAKDKQWKSELDAREAKWQEFLSKQIKPAPVSNNSKKTRKKGSRRESKNSENQLSQSISSGPGMFSSPSSSNTSSSGSSTPEPLSSELDKANDQKEDRFTTRKSKDDRVC